MAENKQDTVRGRPRKRRELRSVTGVEHPDHIRAVGARLWQQLGGVGRARRPTCGHCQCRPDTKWTGEEGAEQVAKEINPTGL